MAARKEIATRNAVDAARVILSSRVPSMLALLEALTLAPIERSHNADDPDRSSRLAADRIRIADRKVQLLAINSWLDRAGVIPPKAQTERGADIQLAEMTVTELRRLADTLDGEIAERAKVIPGTVADTPAITTIEDIM